MSGQETRNTVSRRTKAMVRRVPLFGALVDCRLADHGETVKQVFVTLLLATAPFWLGAMIIVGLSVDHNLTIVKAFWSTVWDGELFMCATSLLAPIFWIALEDPKGVGKFPSRLAHFVIVAVVIIIASVFYGLSVAGNHLQQPYTLHLSVWTFCIAVLVLYLSTVYHTNRLNASGAFREQEEEFTSAYRRHRQ